VSGDLLKLLGDGLKILTKLINTMYETGEWSKDFTEVSDCLKEEATSYKMQRPSHIQQRYLEEGLKGKLRMYLEKISLDLEEEKEVGMQSEC
jgi:hypothetical protein